MQNARGHLGHAGLARDIEQLLVRLGQIGFRLLALGDITQEGVEHVAVTDANGTDGQLDRYLARTGFDGQQLDEPEDPRRRHNLWDPVDDAVDKAG